MMAGEQDLLRAAAQAEVSGLSPHWLGDAAGLNEAEVFYAREVVRLLAQAVERKAAESDTATREQHRG